MKEIIRSAYFKVVTEVILLILLGILFVANPIIAGTTIAQIFGIVLIAAGAANMLRFCFSSNLRGSMLSGVLMIIFGIFVLNHLVFIVSLFSYIFSILIIISGVNCLENAMQLKTPDGNGWAFSVILSFIIAAAGVVLLFVPFAAAETLFIILGIVMILSGINELITLIQLKKIGKVFMQGFKDIRDELNGDIIDEDDVKRNKHRF